MISLLVKSRIAKRKKKEKLQQELDGMQHFPEENLAMFLSVGLVLAQD